jgi:HlyD family secretion protein
VRFRVDAFPDDTFSGSVTQVRLQAVVEQNVVSYITVIDVPNVEMKLKPGMTANVTIEIARNDDVLRVPAAALRFRPTSELFAALGQPAPAPGGREGHAHVWVLREQRLESVRVELGISDGTTTAVRGGDLREGDQVVTSTTTASTSTAAQSTSSPLLPFGGRGRTGGTRPATPATGRGSQ